MTPSLSPQMLEVCGQFEQVLITALLPQSMFMAPTLDAPNGDDSSQKASGNNALFGQALATAIERAGGLGVGRELAALLTEDKS